MANLVELMKTAANEANEAKKPAGIFVGTVIKTAPLEIQIDQKTILTQAFLILTNAVKDHYIDISVSHSVESSSVEHTHPVKGTTNEADSHTHSFDSVSEENNPSTSHGHAYKGRKKVLVHNGLKNGEKVIMIRKQGGQEFIVLDRTSEAATVGQWI